MIAVCSVCGDDHETDNCSVTQNLKLVNDSLIESLILSDCNWVWTLTSQLCSAGSRFRGFVTSKTYPSEKPKS